MSTALIVNPFVGAFGAAFNPLTAITWVVAHWASDPGWTPPSDGAALASGWADGSGNGRTITQATSGFRPVYRASVANLNNKPAVEFDGTDDILVNSSGFTQAQPFTAVAVVSAWGSYGTGDTARMLSSNSGQVQSGHGYPGTNDLTLFGGGADHRGPSPVVTLDTTSAYLVYLFYNGASSQLEKNGLAPRTVTATPGTAGLATDWTVGARSDGYRYSAMKLAFLGIYAGDFSANANYANFKSWVTSFYGVTMGLTVPNYPSAGSKVEEFRDDFADGSVNAYYNDKSGSGIAETGGEVQLTVPSGGETYFGTLTALTMASSYFMAKVGIGFATGNYYANLLLWFNSANNCGMGVENGNMTFKFTQASTSTHYTGTAVPYNGTNHQWWRISVSGTTMTFETSANGTSWSNPFGVTRTLSGTWYTTVNPYLDVTGQSGAGGHVKFYDMNVIP